MFTKCQPPKSPYYKNEYSHCGDPKIADPLFMENVADIAETLAEILIVCGINSCRARATKSIVIKAFQFYDNKRHQFDVAEIKGISRKSIICEFQRKCMMTYIEALLTYGFLKRALKAFYCQTPNFSIRSPIIEAILLKEYEYVWQHAAMRTHQLFESFEHMFCNAHKSYAKKITQIYKELHERLKSRADPIIVEDFLPRGCSKRIIPGTKSVPKLEKEKPKCVEKCKIVDDMRAYVKNFPMKEIYVKAKHSISSPCGAIASSHQMRQSPPSGDDPKDKENKPNNVALNLPRCHQCNCPQLLCDCEVDSDSGVLIIDCSQGPFKCEWVRVDKDDELDPCIEKIELHQCPVDCISSDGSDESGEYQECESFAESETEDISKNAEKCTTTHD